MERKEATAELKLLLQVHPGTPQAKQAEALLQGEAQAVELLISWAQHGPEAARVDKVDVELVDDSILYTTFDKKPTV